MFKLDNDFLQKVGLGDLPEKLDNQKPVMLRHIYKELEGRVGERLAAQMSEEQLLDFEGYVQRKDEGGALQWLETNLPNYRDVVSEELAKLEAEVAGGAKQIMENTVLELRAEVARLEAAGYGQAA